MSAALAVVVEASPEAVTSADLALIEFERTWWKYQGAKSTEILRRFGMTEPSYYARLHWVIDQPKALAYDAVTVNRLRDLRDRRRAVRTRGTAAAGVDTRPDVGGVRPALVLGGAKP